MTRDDYILRMLTKVSKKRLEYFVVSRVIHGLNDFEIEFVTQQLVRRPDGSRALTDMYFPQFGIHLEIDEAQHEHEIHKAADKKRTEDIVSVTDHQIDRIKASVPLDQIIKQTDKFILKLRALRDTKKSNNDFVPWDLEKRYDPETYRDSGAIRVEQNVLFRRQADALRLFDYKGGNYQRGGWRLKDGSDDFVWFPRLYKQHLWDNELSARGNEIVERPLHNKESIPPIKYEENFNRIVFARARDVLGHTLYRYVGTFRHNPLKSKIGENYFDLRTSQQEILLPPKGTYLPL